MKGIEVPLEILEQRDVLEGYHNYRQLPTATHVGMACSDYLSYIGL
jgi:hypothetical protein